MEEHARDPVFSEAYQEYLEMILRLEREKISSATVEDETWITNTEIANSLHFKPPSVTEMLDKLSQKGLIEWQKRHGVRLTEAGRDLAIRILDAHYLLEDFFTVVLGLDKIEDIDLKHRLACALEHHLITEPKLVDALSRSIKNVKNITS
nr:metal-dependent transcriptional regulator [Candidatus Sigynarchaeota archaeon]